MITLIKMPYWWASPHHKVEFTFDYESKDVLFLANSLEKLSIVCSAPFSETVNVGDIIYLIDGFYKGYHIVEYAAAGQFRTSTDWDYSAGAPTATKAKFITDHSFELFAGYPSGHPFATFRPYAKIADFVPEPDPSGYLVVNVAGYLKSLFDAENYLELTSIGSKAYFTGLFNRYVLKSESQTYPDRRVIQAGVDQFEIVKHYHNTGVNLTAQFPNGIIFDSCETLLTLLDDEGVYLRRYVDGELSQTPVVFGTGFSNGFLKT